MGFELAQDFYNNIDDPKTQELFLEALGEWQKQEPKEALKFSYRSKDLEVLQQLAEARKEDKNLFKKAS